MYPSQEGRELAVLLKISRELDVCGDLTATVDNPSELMAWTSVLRDPAIVAWKATDSRCRFIQVSADHHRAPIRGHIAAVLTCDEHAEFWAALDLGDLPPGRTRSLSLKELSTAWESLPLLPPDDQGPPEPPSMAEGAA
jgi:hypothetical protein